jgi:hypothetical protein
MSIGSTNATKSEYLQVEIVSETESETNLEETSMDLSNDFFDRRSDPLLAKIDLDEFMASAAHAKLRSHTTAEHLSKVWPIDLKTARKILEVTSQNCARTDNLALSRNYSTNNRMLRYKRLDEYFFMDTFFSTKKAGKSSRGNTCCQLFVTDKGFVYVVPMKTKLEVMQAVEQFAKEIGAPDAIISDGAPEQKSQEMRKFLNEIGTRLQVHGEGTPSWASKAKLYMGLVKDAVRKDLKDSNCPLAF